MKKTILFTLTALTAACINLTQAATPNPFAKPSSLPLEAPEFNKITDDDYLPAFEQGMKEQLTEINAIANNPSTPTFENTIVALEKSGRMLERVSEVFFAVVQANTNQKLDDVQKTITPMLAEHRDAIYLNPTLFSRVKTIYDQQSRFKLDAESKQLLNIYYQQFIHAGANLNASEKMQLQTLNKIIANLETAFQQKLLAASKNGALTIDDISKLDGLSDNEIDALTVIKDNKKSYVIPLQNTTLQPLLSELKDRKTREMLFDHSWNRAEKDDTNDTRRLITILATMRAKKAELLGYSNYAAYTLYDQMAQNTDHVHQFLNQLISPTAVKTAEDAKDIQTLINKNDSFELKPWDWNYYAEQIRKEKFDVNQNEVKPYFELNNVLTNGVFYAATQLYGITFKERFDLPVYHPDVRVFEVLDQDHSLLGIIYLDYFRRDNKTGGAWMSNFVQQSLLLGTKPVVYNVTNFTKPAAGQPALLTTDDVRTMFHEFGHALQGLFSHCNYPLISSNIARDYVELPSQFNEHWAFYPEVLAHYAIHYQTGKPLSQALIDKIVKAQVFNQGYSIGETLAAASLDMKWHEIASSATNINVDTFETQALKDSLTDFPNVASRYRSSYFLHIWANGYSAGYYAYLWTEMLDDDVYEWFTQHGGMTRENGQRFRDMILARGHTEDYMSMFKSFYGKDPTIEPMLKHRGLLNRH